MMQNFGNLEVGLSHGLELLPLHRFALTSFSWTCGGPRFLPCLQTHPLCWWYNVSLRENKVAKIGEVLWKDSWTNWCSKVSSQKTWIRLKLESQRCRSWSSITWCGWTFAISFMVAYGRHGWKGPDGDKVEGLMTLHDCFSKEVVKILFEYYVFSCFEIFSVLWSFVECV